MISINITKRKISFKEGLSGIKKYRILKDIWYKQRFLLSYNFPDFSLIGERSDLIPNTIYFEEDKNL